MKKFIIKLTILLLLVVAVDALAGVTLRKLVTTAKGGDTARNEYIAHKLNADILIYGSSRSIHHYDPQILEDSLGMTCYNCGQDGMGIILFYARYLMACKHYTPKVIIYDPLIGFDLEKGDNSKYLSWLRPYYNEPSIDSIFWSLDPIERIKMQSQMFRYNGKVLQILTDNLTNMREENKGYRPTDKVMNYDVYGLTSTQKYEIDSLKLQYIEKLIVSCKEHKTKLIFSLSPFYKGSKYIQEDYAPVLELCKKNDIPFINHFSDSDIVNEKLNFEDSYHMNREGATNFSKRLASELKKDYL